LNGELVPPLAGGARQMLATGFPTRSNPAEVTARLVEAARDWTKIRMLGSAALSLAWVALGRLDGYEERNIMWWDVAAGVALALGSGAGRVELRPRESYAMDVSVEA
jgi:myo-inositol-1(or 4)-monophosphatase